MSEPKKTDGKKPKLPYAITPAVLPMVTIGVTLPVCVAASLEELSRETGQSVGELILQKFRKPSAFDVVSSLN
jgi:hypothetical protein